MTNLLFSNFLQTRNASKKSYSKSRARKALKKPRKTSALCVEFFSKVFDVIYERTKLECLESIHACLGTREIDKLILDGGRIPVGSAEERNDELEAKRNS